MNPLKTARMSICGKTTAREQTTEELMCLSPSGPLDLFLLITVTHQFDVVDVLAGTVYCTQITASLVNARLRLPLSRMHVVALNTPIMVEGVRVTFVDANHCPGAAMILFEPPSGAPILHTGDCRCAAPANMAFMCMCVSVCGVSVPYVH
jgi:hypothetical protein